jgi:mono/diheme cytochrome c family protein
MHPPYVRALLLSGICLTAVSCQSRPAAEQQAVVRGRALADKWCSECHRVSPDQPSGMRAGHLLPPPVVAPSFMAIASGPEADRSDLSRLTAELHLPMPTYRLWPREQDDVITYILSLKDDPAN